MGDSAEPRPGKDTVIDALVLAFSYSELRDLCGTDALRSVLGVKYHDLVAGGAFDLQQVWDLLEGQPGFDPAAAQAPLLLFKSWQAHLGVEIALPRSLASLPETERDLRARTCAVPPAQLTRLLRPKSTTSERGAPVVQEAEDRGDARRSKLILWSAAAVASVCFLFVSITLYSHCGRDARWRPGGPHVAQLQADFPVHSAKRLGGQIGVQIRDERWFDRADGEKRAQLEAALRRLQRDDESARVLFLQDARGRLRASAQFLPDSRDAIAVRFY